MKAEMLQSRIERVQQKRCNICKERDSIKKRLDSATYFNRPLAVEVLDDYKEQIAQCDMFITYLQRRTEVGKYE
jgi:NAD-dependent SIR2 family protein deacetylase